MFLTSCRFHSAIWILFLLDRGLSFSEITTLDVAFWSVIILVSFPVGVLTDRFGRKKGIVLGDLLISIGLLLFVFYPSVIGVLIAYLFWGSGIAFMNGPTQAFIYDYLKMENRTEQFSSVWRNSIILSHFAWAFSSMIGGFIAEYDLGYPFFVVAVFFLVAAIFATSYDEKRPEEEETNSPMELFQEAVNITRKTPKIQIFFVLYSIITCLSFIEVIFRAPYLKDFGFDEGDIGVIYLFVILLGALGAYGSKSLSTKIGSDHITFILIGGLLGLSLFTLSQASEFSALALILIISLCRGGIAPLFANILNDWIPSRIRASMITLASGFSLSVLLFLEPLSGIIAESTSIQDAFIVLATINMIALLLFSMLWIRSLKKANNLEIQIELT